MSKPGSVRFTSKLLQEYCVAAIKNAAALAAEALLLLQHKHFARAYFLAVASIEETGKASTAFDAQGRNFADPAVAARLKNAMEDHGQKLSAAFTPWLAASPNIRAEAMPVIELMLELKRGREPSMYTDIQDDGTSVQEPSSVVRQEAALDCVRLATECLRVALKHVAEKRPTQYTRAQDQLFAMKPSHYQKIAHTEDFWWFFLSRAEAGQLDLAEAVLAYREQYVRPGRTFRPMVGNK